MYHGMREVRASFLAELIARRPKEGLPSQIWVVLPEYSRDPWHESPRLGSIFFDLDAWQLLHGGFSKTVASFLPFRYSVHSTIKVTKLLNFGASPRPQSPEGPGTQDVSASKQRRKLQGEKHYDDDAADGAAAAAAAAATASAAADELEEEQKEEEEDDENLRLLYY